MTMTSLATRVYELLRQVPKGKITTYKAVAEALHTRAYRAVGQCVRKNPYPFPTCTDESKQIPCHRVVSSDGTIGGFMGQRTGMAIAKKIALLESEGVHVSDFRIVNFESKYHGFSNN